MVTKIGRDYLTGYTQGFTKSKSIAGGVYGMRYSVCSMNPIQNTVYKILNTFLSSKLLENRDDIY